MRKASNTNLREFYKVLDQHASNSSRPRKTRQDGEAYKAEETKETPRLNSAAVKPYPGGIETQETGIR